MTAATRKKAKAQAKRTIPCKLCGAKIEFTSGLSEVESHWEDAHPEDLAGLRKKLGHEEEA